MTIPPTISEGATGPGPEMQHQGCRGLTERSGCPFGSASARSPARAMTSTWTSSSERDRVNRFSHDHLP